MKKIGVFVISIAILLNLVLSNNTIAADIPDNNPNITENASFENLDGSVPEKWNGWNNNWKTSKVSHSGIVSAAIQNDDPAKYNLLIETIPAYPGSTYDYSCWIKTENVNKGGQATICIEWQDRDGKYVGGSYANGITGTNDWTKVSRKSDQAPASACTLRITLYLTKGSTGKAWFDDIYLAESCKPFVGQIDLPCYKGQLTGGNASAPININGQIGQSYLSKNISITAKITSISQEKEYVSHVIEKPKNQLVDFEMPTASLPNGDYRVSFDLVETQTKTKYCEMNSTFSKVDAPQNNKVSFRSDNIAVVNDVPFFPLGVYEGANPGSSSSLTRLSEIAAGGFNCFMNYGQNDSSIASISNYLNCANELGLKCIYSLKDIVLNKMTKYGDWNGSEEIINGLVTQFENNPALFAWYLNDEGPLTMHDQLLSAYKQVSKLDPNHPGYSVLCQINQLNSYKDTTDVFGVDMYPITYADSPVNEVATWTDEAVKTERPVWNAIQIFNKSIYNPNLKSIPPSQDQIRCMTFLALTHGATGLMFYSYSDLKQSPNFDENWENVTTVVSEVNSILPWLLSTERGDFKQIEGLDTRYFQNGNEGLLIVVNPGDQIVSAQIPIQVSAEKVTNFSSGNDCAVKNNSIQDELKPLEVKLYKVTLSM